MQVRQLVFDGSGGRIVAHALVLSNRAEYVIRDRLGVIYYKMERELSNSAPAMYEPDCMQDPKP